MLDQRAVLLAPLATAGMTALALTHELARETRTLERSSEKIRRLAKTHEIPELDAMAAEFDGLCSRLEALQELFAPLLSEEDMAPTERLRVRPLVQQVARSMRPLVPRSSSICAAYQVLSDFPLDRLPNGTRYCRT